MIVLSKLLPLMVYPFGLALECLIVAAVLIYKKKTTAPAILTGWALFLLLVFSNQIVSDGLCRNLERRYLPVDELKVKADAIVVLGGACKPKMYPRTHVEYGEGAERVFEGIRLYKAQAAPVIIPTGGGIDFILKGQKEGNDMREVMVEFGVPESAVIAETESRNTYENAVYVKKIMEERKIPLNIILVTSATHMVRSVPIFKRAGFTLIPAPVDYLVEDGNMSWYRLLPRVECLFLSTIAIKEWIGIAYYKMMGWL